MFDESSSTFFPEKKKTNNPSKSVYIIYVQETGVANTYGAQKLKSQKKHPQAVLFALFLSFFFSGGQSLTGTVLVREARGLAAAVDAVALGAARGQRLLHRRGSLVRRPSRARLRRRRRRRPIDVTVQQGRALVLVVGIVLDTAAGPAVLVGRGPVRSLQARRHVAHGRMRRVRDLRTHTHTRARLVKKPCTGIRVGAISTFNLGEG